MKLHIATLLTDENVDSKYIEIVDRSGTYIVPITTIEFDGDVKKKISDMVDYLYKFAGAGISMQDFAAEMLSK